MLLNFIKLYRWEYQNYSSLLTIWVTKELFIQVKGYCILFHKTFSSAFSYMACLQLRSFSLLNFNSESLDIKESPIEKWLTKVKSMFYLHTDRTRIFFFKTYLRGPLIIKSLRYFIFKYFLRDICFFYQHEVLSPPFPLFTLQL